MFGSLYISRLLDVFPYLIWVGGAILGGVSGALIIDDPIFGGAFSSASSLANLIVPVIAALFVVQISRVIAANASAMGALQKPRPLFDIVWKSAAQPPVADAQPLRAADIALPAAAPTDSVFTAAQPARVLVAEVGDAPAALESPPDKPKLPPAPAAIEGNEHRVVMALGLFMMVSGGAIYYMLNAYEAPVPETFFTYFCKQPALSIRFQPSAKQIRFATPKGSVTTTVIEDRIVWEDYREAGARLALAPPVKIIMADATKLVVNGGMFENTSCLVVAQR
jgi:hypothetical protein